MKFSIDEISPQNDRVALVTGGNSGIGLESCRALAKKGARVVMASRNAQKAKVAQQDILNSAPDAHVEVLALNLSDLDSVKRFAGEFGEKYNRLDYLFNNAGVMFPPLEKTLQGYELTFATNHLGHFLLTGLLLEKLTSTPGSRVVTVSSLAHRQGKIDFDNLNAENKYSKIGAYSQSKLANLIFSMELDRRLRRSNASTIAVAAHPGWTRTNLQVHTKIFTFLNPYLGQGPADGALPSLCAAVTPEVEGGEYFGPSGFMEIKGTPKRVKAIAAAHNQEIATRLWKLSEEMTGFSYLG